MTIPEILKEVKAICQRLSDEEREMLLLSIINLMDNNEEELYVLESDTE